MKQAQYIAIFWGLLAAGLLGIAIFVGSRNLLACLLAYVAQLPRKLDVF